MVHTQCHYIIMFYSVPAFPAHFPSFCLSQYCLFFSYMITNWEFMEILSSLYCSGWGVPDAVLLHCLRLMCMLSDSSSNSEILKDSWNCLSQTYHHCADITWWAGYHRSLFQETNLYMWSMSFHYPCTMLLFCYSQNSNNRSFTVHRSINLWGFTAAVMVSNTVLLLHCLRLICIPLDGKLA